MLMNSVKNFKQQTEIKFASASIIICHNFEMLRQGWISWLKQKKFTQLFGVKKTKRSGKNSQHSLCKGTRINFGCDLICKVGKQKIASADFEPHQQTRIKRFRSGNSWLQVNWKWILFRQKFKYNAPTKH